MRVVNLVLALLSFLTISSLSGNWALAESDCNLVARAGEVASELRGLPLKIPVPCRVTDKAAVEQYLRQTIKQKIPAQKLKGEEVAFKILGIIPQEFDYVDGIIALYTEQIGGYYDAEKNYYAMAAWMPELMQLPVAVHELTHALQDQHFNLDSFTAEQDRSTDELLARSALIEGDATAVMIDHSRMLAGQGPVSEEESVSVFLAQNLMGMMLSPSLHSAPPALQALMIFPYLSGLNYTHALLRVGGYSSVNQAYERPPASTEDILHPEKYLKGADSPKKISLPSPSSGESNLSQILQDTFGEFILSTLLNSWLPPGISAPGAAGWGGDRIAVYEGSDRFLLHWQLVMDSVADAEELAKLLFQAYRKRFTELSGEWNSFDSKQSGKVKLQLKQTDKTIVIDGFLLK